MAFKIILCVSALLIQNNLGEIIDNVIIDNCNVCDDCGNSNSSDSESDNSNNSIDLGSYSSNADSSNIVSFIRNIGSYSNIGTDSYKASITNSCLKSSGGPFFITCTGPVAPSGINVDARNNLAGELYITGHLPFLSTVGFESSFPTNVQASVAYGCGDGRIGIQKIIGGSDVSAKSGVCSCNKN